MWINSFANTCKPKSYLCDVSGKLVKALLKVPHFGDVILGRREQHSIAHEQRVDSAGVRVAIIQLENHLPTRDPVHHNLPGAVADEQEALVLVGAQLRRRHALAV